MTRTIPWAFQDGGLGAIISREAIDANTLSEVASTTGGTIFWAGDHRGEGTIISVEPISTLASRRLTLSITGTFVGTNSHNLKRAILTSMTSVTHALSNNTVVSITVTNRTNTETGAILRAEEERLSKLRTVGTRPVGIAIASRCDN